MGKKTPLHQQHLESGARIVDFGGWDMPVHYGSQLDEHRLVRESAGVFDVSHMTVLDVSGKQALGFLSYLLSNDVNKLVKTGKALYTTMLNDEGKILDDLIVYRRQHDFRLVTNCATREKDLTWIARHSDSYDCEVVERPELAILAIQGPETLERMRQVFAKDEMRQIENLGAFDSVELGSMYVATTGYTGEAGLEIILPAPEAPGFWQALLKAGIRPVGLGARDTLRLEAGMNLYGSDMDESVSPLESSISWTLSMSDDRDFIGKESLLRQKSEGVERNLIGLVMREKGVLRSGYGVFREGSLVGTITSGIFSPTLGYSIALARISKGEGDLQVEIRKKMVEVKVVRPPFVRNGKQVYKT